MSIVYDEQIGEWVASFPNRPALGEFYGDTMKAAEAAAVDALRVNSEHARRNTWTPIAPGVYEVKGVGR